MYAPFVSAERVVGLEFGAQKHGMSMLCSRLAALCKHHCVTQFDGKVLFTTQGLVDICFGFIAVVDCQWMEGIKHRGSCHYWSRKAFSQHRVTVEGVTVKLFCCGFVH